MWGVGEWHSLKEETGGVSGTKQPRVELPVANTGQFCSEAMLPGSFKRDEPEVSPHPKTDGAAPAISPILCALNKEGP